MIAALIAALRFLPRSERAPAHPLDVRGLLLMSTGLPLLTYERQRPVQGSALLAFSVAYELELAGVLEVLDLCGLPLLREERGEGHPLVVAGGPLTFSNPEPLEPFADVLVQGEAEELRKRLNHFRTSLGRFFIDKQEQIDLMLIAAIVA